MKEKRLTQMLKLRLIQEELAELVLQEELSRLNQLERTRIAAESARAGHQDLARNSWRENERAMASVHAWEADITSARTAALAELEKASQIAVRDLQALYLGQRQEKRRVEILVEESQVKAHDLASRREERELNDWFLQRYSRRSGSVLKADESDARRKAYR